MAPETAGIWWRLTALFGLVAGLALSPLAPGSPAPLGLVAIGAAALFVTRPSPGERGVRPWLGALCAVSVVTGLVVGTARLDSRDDGMADASAGDRLELRGTVVSQPREGAGFTRFAFESADGRVVVEAGADTPVDEGSIVDVAGTVRLPAPWEADSIERLGAGLVLRAVEVRPTGQERGGLRGALDDVRRRAEEALSSGTPPSSSALMRGFVLGQDDLISEDVRDEFRRSGLAHVLAVSGQNVMLLALLTGPILALAGIPIRARLVVLMAVIAIYVPVAGAGASIQRAGVMGAAGIVAALSGRPRAAWYALGLAAAVTLAIDPRATADIGWQLSFAAVAGLLVLAGPIAAAIGGARGGARGALAEGAAMTLAATLATGPLVAHHFGTVSLTAIAANLLALPAIAPAMWLGMLAGALGQIPGAPTEPLTWLGGLFAGFIAWVAKVFGPTWAQLDIPEPGPATALASNIALVGLARIVCEWRIRRSRMATAWRLPRAATCAAAASVVVVALGLIGSGTGTKAVGEDRPSDLQIRFLDVGQGDAILVSPRGSPPMLVDTGPPSGRVWERLDALGVDRLSAVAITHDELDHSGALTEVLQRVQVDDLLVGTRAPTSCSSFNCPPVTRLGSGTRFRLGRAKVEVLWPSRLAEEGDDPNATALVLRISSGEFDALLTGDAESEIASYRPVPAELVKVAHHGSADAGLDRLLDLTSPDLAVVSVGAGNPFRHPTPETLDELSAHDVPYVRTDEAGEVVVEVRGDGWSVG